MYSINLQLFVKISLYNWAQFRKICLLPSKPLLGILNCYQFNFFRRETLIYHDWHNIISDMRVSVSAKMYLKS